MAQLLEYYQYSITRRSTDITELLSLAPVLRVGKALPV
ncbi:hypothetical protein BTN49_1785 [Candidatus Enterovibrio escicola]|uniref:Uncharacterized protein n=1 Tax=Candidatus Enterovibrio escicola TaxID=1927127 RepID=A0A2A5T338_9GAMM|nr:hypothetical protein BTN49_1785 [Candidatus Enterovibrio escacola]